MLKFVSNFYGDGKIRAVGANHTNTSKAQPDPWESAIYSFEIPNDPVKPWVKTKISDGIKSGPGSNFAPQAAPGIFGHGDLDNDGVIDLIVSGDGDPRVFWIEQVSPGKFQTRVLIQNLSQAGGMIITDIDGDGKNEAVVTGYDASKVLILKHK